MGDLVGRTFEERAGSAMHIPRPRFTVRRMMVAVAIVAMAIGVEAFRQRRNALLAKAATYADGEKRAMRTERLIVEYEALLARSLDRVHARRKPSVPPSVFGVRVLPKWIVPSQEEYDQKLADERKDRAASRERWHRLVSWYAEGRARYERAARYPCLPVAPDPPEPE